MTIFILSFAIFALAAFALGMGVLFMGRDAHVGCRGLPNKSGDCDKRAVCGAVCRLKQ